MALKWVYKRVVAGAVCHKLDQSVIHFYFAEGELRSFTKKHPSLSRRSTLKRRNKAQRNRIGKKSNISYIPLKISNKPLL